MAIDRKHHRLLIGCSNKMAAVVDTESGKVVATVPIGDGVDANAFDPGTELGFSSNGDGTLTVIKEESAGPLHRRRDRPHPPGRAHHGARREDPQRLPGRPPSSARRPPPRRSSRARGRPFCRTPSSFSSSAGKDLMSAGIPSSGREWLAVCWPWPF